MKDKKIVIKVPEKKEKAPSVNTNNLTHVNQATFSEDATLSQVSAPRANFKDDTASGSAPRNLSHLSPEERYCLLTDNGCNRGINLLTGQIAKKPLFTVDIDEVSICTNIAGGNFKIWSSNTSLIELHKKGYHVGEVELNLFSYFKMPGNTSYSTSYLNKTQSENETLYMEHYVPKGFCDFFNIEKNLSGEFKNFFLERGVTKETIAEFFEIYGHVIGTRVVFGGKLISQSTYTKTELNDAKKKQLEGRIAASFNPGTVSGGLGYAGGGSEKEGRAYSEVNEWKDITTIGGQPEKSNDISQWKASLASDPSYWQPIQFFGHKFTVDLLDEETRAEILCLTELSNPTKFKTGLYKITNADTGISIAEEVSGLASDSVLGLIQTESGYLICKPASQMNRLEYLLQSLWGICFEHRMQIYKDLYGCYVEHCFWNIEKVSQNLIAEFTINNKK